MIAVILFTGFYFLREGSASERLIQSTDSSHQATESFPQTKDPIFYHPERDIKQLHSNVAELMKFGENYVELPIKLVGSTWQFSREVKFRHRFYYLDMLRIEIRQQIAAPGAYSVVAYAKKFYEHITFPPNSYILDRSGNMTVKLASSTDKEKVYYIYSIWKFFFGL